MKRNSGSSCYFQELQGKSQKLLKYFLYFGLFNCYYFYIKHVYTPVEKKKDFKSFSLNTMTFFSSEVVLNYKNVSGSPDQVLQNVHVQLYPHQPPKSFPLHLYFIMSKKLPKTLKWQTRLLGVFCFVLFCIFIWMLSLACIFI